MVFNDTFNNISVTVHSKCINDQTLRSDIFHPKCPTNIRQIWESTLSMSDYLVGHFGLGRTFWSDVRVDIKRFFFTFLEVNMSNILWSMRICKRTFFPVCRITVVKELRSKMLGQHPGYFKAVFLKKTQIIIVSIYEYTVYIMFWIMMLYDCYYY